VEVGCGLGLPGVVAARRGGRVTFVDREPAPLAFVRASLAASGVVAGGLVVGDFTRPPFGGVFDTVLGAEILYDRAVFAAVARGLARLLAPGGIALLTDASRIDTRAFYPELAAHGLVFESTVERVVEERSPVDVRLVTIRHARAG
jgi:2-polyprenyl-3-methyl-5-hydroxy-6-metoxy-1,4-benzoquinol methylase